MEWNQFKDIIRVNHPGRRITKIKCPDCGKFVYLCDVVLTTYPETYSYDCSCGWHGLAHVKWEDWMEYMSNRE